MPSPGETPQHAGGPVASRTQGAGADTAAHGPRRDRQALVALGLVLALLAVQLVASSRALLAFDYPYLTRGPFTLSNVLASGSDPRKVYFRAVLGLRETVGARDVGLLVVPVEPVGDRLETFAQDLLEGRGRLGTYRWHLTDVEFDGLLARSGAVQPEPGAFIVPREVPGRAYVMYADAAQRRVAIVPVVTSDLPPFVAAPAGSP